MKLEDQNNIVKNEIEKLHYMFSEKINVMEQMNAPCSEIRRLIDRRSELENILANYYDFYNSNTPNQLEIACKIGDKYSLPIEEK